MKLFLILIILLFEIPTDGARPKKCFSNITGYCRKKCNLGEISEVGCLRGKLCCVNEEENKKYQQVHQPPQPSNEKPDDIIDYNMLPTVTIVTVQL
ncbi:beta-defensin 128 [Cynocephalus volans]|uniref:beta-defensin 128 n=1 Tax=Cynocephalus volans TaxID=110931 RepID=UPI002FC98C34